MIGVQWDISWHRSIGRDAFWTAPHVAIYLCGVLAGLSCGYLILRSTFGRSPEAERMRGASVRVLGLRAPLGAFISAWGGAVMLVSAPFDNWWHDTYGLDVKILSPPHSVLSIGIVAVELGTLMLILGYRNRAEGALKTRLDASFLYVAGMILVAELTAMIEMTARPRMHNGHFYFVIALHVPVVLTAIARASERRAAATIAAGVYTALMIGLLWILPLFPAEPRLGPVYHPVDRFVPWEFPLLIVVPALAWDVVRARVGGRLSGWAEALVAGVIFFGLFLLVQWPFADFLQSPLARNAIFGADYFGYNTRPTSLYFRHLFETNESDVERWSYLAAAMLASIAMSRLGAASGDWMRRVRR
jgi:hypothetical protein